MNLKETDVTKELEDPRRLSKQEEHILQLFPPSFVPKDQNRLCTDDKNRKRAELWVKANVYVM